MSASGGVSAQADHAGPGRRDGEVALLLDIIAATSSGPGVGTDGGGGGPDDHGGHGIDVCFVHVLDDTDRSG